MHFRRYTIWNTGRLTTPEVSFWAGNLANTWRITTPPPSPPTRPAFLAGSTSSLRRVASMDISAALNGTWDASRPAVRIAGDIIAHASTPGLNTLTSGLADAAAMLTSGLSAITLEAGSSGPQLPESTIYKWSCGHFSRPLLEPSHDDEEEILARREMREKEALNGIARCQHSSKYLSNTLSSFFPGWSANTLVIIFVSARGEYLQ